VSAFFTFSLAGLASDQQGVVIHSQKNWYLDALAPFGTPLAD